MAKALRTAAFVVGAVALVATGVGAVAGVAGIATTVAAGASASTAAFFATAASVASIAGFAAGALALAAAASTKPPGSVGSPTKFKIDKESGLPYAVGRTYSGGNVVHRAFYGAKNSLESWVTVHSLGPVKSLGPLQIDKVVVPFSGGAAGGAYAGKMWLSEQLGACPEATALAGPSGAIPGWGPSSKLSGLAADLWTLKFDEKGKTFPNGVPQRGREIEGVFVYDPRLDSTYPGGVGPCRLGVEATYVWSENPALHTLTWAFGRIQNGMLVAGGGMQVTGIDMPPFVEWANVCDANGWKVGGIVYTSADNSWDCAVMLAQAGGGEIMPVGAQLSCTFAAPRVSIGTITSADIIGDLDVPVSSSRRTRRNTVIPQVRLESHGWEMVPLDAITIPEYVTADGGKRPKEIRFPLVQDADQGAQLGLYELLNLRELDGIVLPCKVYAIGYRPGDCLTVDVPEANLIARTIVVRTREIEPSTMGVTLSCRSETAGKHAFALGKTGTPPPTPDLTVPPDFNNPLLNPSGGARHVARQSVASPFSSTDTAIAIAQFDAVLDDGTMVTLPDGQIPNLAAGRRWAVYFVPQDIPPIVRNEDGGALLNEDGTTLELQAAVGTYFAMEAPALTAEADPANVFVGFQQTSDGGAYAAAPTPPPGYGGSGNFGGGYELSAQL